MKRLVPFLALLANTCGNWEQGAGVGGAGPGPAGGNAGVESGGSGASAGRDPGGDDRPAFDIEGCDVAPINPNASQQAKNLLCYFHSVYGNSVLSGQEESTWVGGSEYEMQYIFTRTGKYPAVRGMDFQQTGVANRGIAWWQAGGISQIGYHMGIPGDADTYEATMLSVSIDDTLTPGTPLHAAFVRKLDFAAAELQRLEDAGVPVIWRPFHEAGGEWFWWSKEGGAQYVRLWNFVLDYFMNTKQLDNLLWLLPFDGDPNPAFYPGSDRVDLVGADTYARPGNHGPLSSLFQETLAIAGDTIPIALHENGPIPDPDLLQSSGASWVLFNTWHTMHIIDPNTNPVAQLDKTYNHAYVITRDELPSLR